MSTMGREADRIAAIKRKRERQAWAEAERLANCTDGEHKDLVQNCTTSEKTSQLEEVDGFELERLALVVRRTCFLKYAEIVQEWHRRGHLTPEQMEDVRFEGEELLADIELWDYVDRVALGRPA
jgi:hypothetical protein